MDWQAHWIWHPTTGLDDNFYLYARKKITLTTGAPDAHLIITAGSLYKLYINGTYVGRGPNPSDPSRYYYDVLAVGGLLAPGENLIAVVAYNYGPKAHGILNQNYGRGGLLAELRERRDGKVLAATDASWKVLQAAAWDQHAQVNCTLLGDYKESYDSRQEIAGWMAADFDDAEWKEPQDLGQPPMEPYTRLVEREIPFLSDGPRMYPENAYWETASVTYAWRDDWEVYHEQSLIPVNGKVPAAKPTEIKRTHDDFVPSIMLDFGTLVTGYPEIKVRDSAGGVVDVLYGETLKLVRVDRFVLKGGAQTLQPFNRRTFRYLKLQFPETPAKIYLDEVSVALSTYPVEHRGTFACSDPLLNRIWNVARYTMRMSMLDHFVDCPWRERTIYGGDVYPENLIAHYAFGDPRMNRKVLRQMFAIQYDEGALPPYGPYKGCEGFYPSWSGFTGLAFLDHFMLSGDRAFLEELWPAFARLADWTVNETARNKRALIGDPEKGGNFAAWSKAEKTRYQPWSNAPFYLMLRRAAPLAEAMGKREQAARWSQTADRMAAAIRETMLDEAARFVPCSVGGERGKPRQYDNAMLLWMGLLSQDEGVASARNTFVPGVAPLHSPFEGFFMIEGLYRYGLDAEALAFMRDYWGEMLARGATTFWEHFDRTTPHALAHAGLGSSVCHGWSACPGYSLGAHVLGVQPLEPAFAKVLVAPCVADLSWAEGRVPTPQGDVAVSWRAEHGTLRLSVQTPPTSALRVALPAQGTRCDVTVDGDRAAPVFEGGRWVLELPASGAPREIVQTLRHAAG